MDSSQDVFLDQSIDNCASSGNETEEFGITSYRKLLASTKKYLSKSNTISVNIDFFKEFRIILDNCHSCIKMGLQNIDIVVKEIEVNLDKLIELINDILSILQQLTNFLANTVETITMNCREMTSFPTVTGNILIMIFTHCKQSETLYDSHLTNLETQLKDLFRSCHNLQLIYLMILEKSFIFDLSEKYEYEVLIEALVINLTVGDIVQSLDVKTMAEQWKGYTNICEKYANHLVDNSVFENTSKCLTTMAANNIKIALEIDQEQKITMRSLKVTTFVLKLLLKICHTFKHAGSKDVTHILDLIVYIYMHHPSRLTIDGYTSQLVQMIQPTIISPTDPLIHELVADDNFANCVLNYDYKKHKKQDMFLGYVLTLISISKAILNTKESSPLWVSTRTNVVTRILEVVPYCFPWFNMGLRFAAPFKTNEVQTYNLYENLLTHTGSLLCVFGCEQYCTVERVVCENIMGNDCCAAMFSADLTALISKVNPNKRLLYDQLVFFCTAFKELEDNTLFAHSPQKSHLSYVIQTLYNCLEPSLKQTFCEQFDTYNEENDTLWTVIKVKGLSREIKMNGEESVVNRMLERLKRFLFGNGDFSGQDMNSLIKSIKLASTCSVIKAENIEEIVTQAWLKLCPKQHHFSLYGETVSKDSMWQFEYYTALVLITDTMLMNFQRDTTNLVKILHIISSAMTSANIDLKLVSLNLILKLSLYSSHCSNDLVHSQLEKIFRAMLFEDNFTFKSKFYETLRKYLSGKKIDSIITNIVKEDPKLLENWNYYLKNDKLKKNVDVKLKEQLFCTTDLEYKHKCIVTNANEDKLLKQLDSRSSSSNFEMCDLEELLHSENNEPVIKKAKLNNSNINDILDRMEKDVEELCKVKENLSDEERVRVNDIIVKIKNVVENSL